MILRGGSRQKRQTPQSVRPRQMRATVDASFRRNVAFISKNQREKAAQHRNATERQLLQKHQQARRRLKMRIVFVAVCGLLLATGFLFRITAVEVVSNASSKLSETDKARYQRIVQEEASRHTILKQSWLLDTNAFTDSLYKRLPEISHVAFSKKSPFHQALTATIRFRTPVFTWMNATGTRQYVDAKGVLFEKNLDPSVAESSLTTVEDQSGTVLAAGDTVLTQEIVTFIGQLHAKLPPLYGGAEIKKVIIPTATREVQIKVDQQPYLIKFSATRPLEEQVGELQLLLQHLQGSGGIIPTTVIDMRVPHKAFYK